MARKSKVSDEQLKQIIEAAIFVSDTPLLLEKLQTTVLEGLNVGPRKLKALMASVQGDYAARGIHLVEVASGFRFQSDESLNPWISKLWQESAPKYSRALLETLSLVAYRQPITRGEIEDVRGVSVNSHIMKTLVERDWIKVVGHKEVPGRPALYATTKGFLDYFSLKSLDELPSMGLFEQQAQDARKQIIEPVEPQVESGSVNEKQDEELTNE